MLVMRLRVGQRRIVWMGLGIIPVQFVTAAPSFVAIARKNQWPSVKCQAFSDDQPMLSRKGDLARYSGYTCATANYYQSRMGNRRELLAQGIDELFVITQGLEWVHVGPPVR